MENHSTASLASQTRPAVQHSTGSRFSEGDTLTRTTAAGVSADRPTDPFADPQSMQHTQNAAAPAPAPPQQQTDVPFYKKRWFIISQIIIIPVGIALLFILLFPVVTAIAQLVIKRSQLGVDVATITSPQNDSFTLSLQGLVTHTGIIPGRVQFTNPINVSWVQDDQTETPIGSFTLDTLYARNKRALVNQTTTFSITDTEAFGEFAGHMITASNFTWRLVSENLHVRAAQFPTSKGIKFDKMLTLNGFNSFNNNVKLLDLQLPSDNPAGGINFVASTQLTNPSPFSLDLGTVVFGLAYKDVQLGSGSSPNTKITVGNNTITLSGTLVPQPSNNLPVVSELFTNYLNGENSDVIASGQSTLQSDGTEIAWLSAGLSQLHLHVPFMSLQGALNPIQSISIGDMGLRFAQPTPWSPSAESHSVRAAMALPFGFDLSIGEIQNKFNITKDDKVVAGLSTPLGASQSQITVENSTFTHGTIDIAIDNTNLDVPDPSHPVFLNFNADLTSSDRANFRLVGQSRAIANTSIGQLTLDPIKFDVPSGLNGLQGLKNLTQLSNVDVDGGTTEGITLGIDVAIHNPSNLNLTVGDLRVQLFRSGEMIGTALMPNLTLLMGDNKVKASSVFAANSNDQAQQTLNDFVGKKDVQLSIAGFDGSTEIASLVSAFETLNIDVTLPSLKTNLLDTAALTVLPTTGRENNISHVTVSLANPFSADLNIKRIQSTVSAFGIQLGSIDSSTSFKTQANSTTTSPDLELNMNLDPSSIFTVTRALAVEAGLGTEQLDGIVQLGGYQYLMTTGPPVSTNAHKRDNLFTGFDLPSFVQKAFTQLKSDVELTAEVEIGVYTTTLKYSQNSLPTKTDETLNLILPVLAHPIVQKIVGGSNLGISQVLITDPQQEQFGSRLNGSITNAGPFDAKIAFPEGATVQWSGQPLGNIKMEDIDVTGDVGAQFAVNSQFQVADVGHLTDFTKTLLTQESFQWDISANNLNVSAIGITVDGITLTPKTVSLKGFNGLKNGVKVETFSLPSNDPDGGITLNLQATTTNPSQVGVELSRLAFDTFAQNVMIAPVATTDTITLAPESSTSMSLKGRLVPQSSDEGLSVVSDIFNRFIHGQDSDVSVHGSGAGPSDVTWLNDGIKSLQIDTVLPNRGPQNIIKSISLNQLTLDFTVDTAYNPSTSSDNTEASFGLPNGFDFPIDISALQQTITVSSNGQDFAQLAIPKGPSTTDVDTRVIHLGFNNVPFAVSDGQQETFNQFLAATTMTKSQTLGLSGSADANANTAVGLLGLKDISFSVQSTIAGLDGLDEKPVTVSDLDVNHGFPDFLLIKVNTALFNPSNLTIGTGDVSFALQFQNAVIGEADLSDMVIKPGNQTYPTDVHYAPQGAAVSAGRALLENFLQGVDVDTTISGSTDSTPIESLKTALSQIVLSPVTIPALHQSLITAVSITFPEDIVQTGMAQTSFTLANPFTASINLLKVGASATFHNLTLGTIDNVDVSSNPIHADGHSNVTSPSLPLKFNLDPATIIQLLTIGAQTNHVDLGGLADLFQFILQNPDFKPPVTTRVDHDQPTCVSGHQPDFDSAILNSLKNLLVELAVDSSVKLDDFPTDLSFAQHNVPANVDQTALFLIGAVAGPVAQHLVDQSELKFDSANITNISNDGFDLALHGSLTNTGPLDANIEFTEPVVVTWQGNNIASIELPPVCAAADDGVPNYSTNAHLTITDIDQFTQFAVFLLHNEDFTWTISTDKLRVTALGTIFENVSLKKDVSFKAFNGLPGVTISNFQLPSDDPAGGIHIETDSQIPSPAQLGIDLGTVTFTSKFKGTTLGPLSTTQALVLAPNSVTSTHLAGRIVPQSGSDLEAVGELFTNFLAAKNQTLQVIGESVQPTGSSGTVGWLTTAIQSLTLDVILPGQSFEIIRSITLSDLDVVLQTEDQAFAPPTSSNHTSAVYRNPFGFSLQVVEAGQTIRLGAGGVDAAELDLPKAAADGGVSTGNDADLHLSWSNQPLKSLNNDAFSAMLAAVTLKQSVDLTLKGSADVTARTSIGDVPISGIPFDVTSSLQGINDFDGTTKLSNVTVTGSGGNGGNEFIVSPLTTELSNPSNVSLHTVDIALPVIYKDVMIGRAAINPFDLVPGDQNYAAEFHYEPENANDTVAQSFLTNFLTSSDDLPLIIQGDAASSPIASLQQSLSGVHLTTSLSGLGQSLIKHINVSITLDSLVTNLVTIDIDLFNPLDAPLHVLFVQSDAGVNGEIFAHFEHQFDSFVVGPGQTVNSGDIPNVLLTQGAIASLDIIPLAMLDTFSAVTAQVGDGGYVVPWLQLTQPGVPTTYTLDLLGLDVGLPKLKAMASSVSESSVAATATTKSESASSEAASQGARTTSESAATTAKASSGGSEETPASTTADSASTSSKQDSEPTPAPQATSSDSSDGSSNPLSVLSL
ncbi:hypothetical protein K435DRAFT_962414 [Dendrothele bispora CBS 962.96]|uniref:Uncharacterized protein n=1 Tax=Dendrothele bispora (strain CBS 962.96) TaxID=1314807 RepID=A0A4S8MLD7_DENBC|nr:hypothetical protein K435DRAFT_962414 [Dendrothele bispora CBS 962.96]